MIYEPTEQLTNGKKKQKNGSMFGTPDTFSQKTFCNT